MLVYCVSVCENAFYTQIVFFVSCRHHHHHAKHVLIFLHLFTCFYVALLVVYYIYISMYKVQQFIVFAI